MRVTSGLADVDFNIRSISREGPYVVIRDRHDGEPGTVVYVSAGDVVAGLKALLARPAAAFFVLTACLRRKMPPPGSEAIQSVTRDRLNNPWL
ncbi:MAG: hypothetical protein JSR66_26760 [Proteobacteria bacterium]|nr:hypothetical protein [Pseudomonadota bacterium]